MDDPRGHQKTIFSHIFLALVSCTWRLRRRAAGLLESSAYRLLLHFEIPHAMPRRFRIERRRWRHRCLERIIERMNRISRFVEGFVEGDDAYRVILTADEHTPLWGYQLPKTAYGIVELPRPGEPNLIERGIPLYAPTPIAKMRVVGHRIVETQLHVDVVWLSGQAIGQTFTITSPEMFDVATYGKAMPRHHAAEPAKISGQLLPFRIYKQSHLLTTASLALLSLMAIWLGSLIATHASELVRR